MQRNNALRSLIGQHIMYGHGVYNGNAEHSYALPIAVYHEFIRRFPTYMAGQESILILGSPQARNWRPAKLQYVDGSGRADVDLGVWRSTTAEEAIKHDSYSYLNNNCFICEIDPPANMHEAEQREVAKKLAALDSILKTLNVHFDTDLLDYKGVADGLDDMLKRSYDNAFNAGIDTGAT
jgi:hypothetical protein